MDFFRGVLKACDEVCGYMRNWKCYVNTWWLNSGVKDEIQKKKEACMFMQKWFHIVERLEFFCLCIFARE